MIHTSIDIPDGVVIERRITTRQRRDPDFPLFTHGD